MIWRSLAVGTTITDLTLRNPSTPSISASSWGTIVDFHVDDARAHECGTSVPEYSSKNTMTGQPSSLFSPTRLEHRAVLPLRSADVLVEQFGTLMLMK